MKKPLLALAVAAMLPLGARALMTEDAALAVVQSMEANGRPAAEIIAHLVDDGRSPTDATTLVVGSTDDGNTRMFATRAGMCQAVLRGEDPAPVGQAALALAGDTVQSVVNTFTPANCDMGLARLPPAGYQGSYAPGGGQSPAD